MAMLYCVISLLFFFQPLYCKDVTLEELHDRILRLESRTEDCLCYRKSASEDRAVSSDREEAGSLDRTGSSDRADSSDREEAGRTERAGSSDITRSMNRVVSSERAEVIARSSVTNVASQPSPHSGSAGTRISVTGMYAFTAILNKTTDIDIGQYIIFDTVLLNIGNAYNVRDGIFASNYTGIYMFTWNLFTNGDVGAKLRVNGIPLVESYVYVEVLHGYYNAHGSAVIHLNAGDYVMLVCDEKGGPLIEKKTTFSGFLISP